jgi:ABC-type dipeptide/oligopeptide/nickel transport system ATPase component
MQNYLKLPFCSTIAGSCGSGKSYLIKYICESFSNIFNGFIVFSNTATFTEDYKFLENYKHKILGSLDFDNELKKIMSIQEKNRNKGIKKQFLIIFDDIFGSIKDSKKFKEFISTYRHYNLSIIFSAQYICGIATYLREISAYVMIFNQKTNNSLKLAYENYFADKYTSFEEFKKNFSLQRYKFYFVDRIINKRYVMKAP